MLRSRTLIYVRKSRVPTINPGGVMFYNFPVGACATIEWDEFVSSFVFCHEVII
jgi:hypothetical protein